MPRDSRPASLVVRVGGLLLVALNLLYIGIFGRSVPIGDDFLVTAPMAGEVGVLQWCWTQYNYHRFPLSKLIYFCCLKISSWNFCVPMVLSVLLLGATGMMLAEGARRLRGGSARYTDLFFPLIFLHGGHAANVLISFQFNLVLPVFFIGLSLFLVAQIRDPLEHRRAWQLGICLLFLSMMGGFGLVFLLSFGCWFIYAGWRSAAHRRLHFLMAGGVIALLGVHFISYHRPTDVPPVEGMGSSLMTALEALTMCFGTAAKKGWVLTHGMVGVVALLILIFTTAITCRAWLRQPSERFRAAGILMFLAGLVGMMLGIGWSRAGFGPLYGLQPRYATLATPLLCCTYYVAELYLSGRLKRLTQIGLFTLAGVLFVIHIKPAINFGRGEALMLDTFLNDIRHGMPRDAILDRYSDQLVLSREKLNKSLQQLHDAGVEPYRDMKD